MKAALAAATGAVAGTVAHGFGWERHALGLVRTDLPISGLGPAFDGFRIGFITDLHHSALVGREDIDRAIAVVMAERPDLVVLGGDYVSYADRKYIEPVAEMLGGLSAPHGVIAILGNHDDDRFVPAALERRGLMVLADARTALEIRGDRLEVAGLKFWTRGVEEIAPVLRGVSAPVLLLAHDPRRIVEAAALDVQAVLAGHTHGGQIVLPVVGALAARKFPIARGRLTRDGAELYVSAGVGTVLVPIRVNCPPEVAIVTLRRRGGVPG